MVNTDLFGMGVFKDISVCFFVSCWSLYLVLIFPLVTFCLVVRLRNSSLNRPYTVPHTLPFLRSTVSFAFDGLRLLSSAR